MVKRDSRFDLLRVIAIFLVVVIHVSNCYCRNFANISHSSFFVAVLFDAISRVSVPIFFMISGGLILKKDCSVKIAKNKVFKFLKILLVWTVIYFIWEYFFLGKTDVNVLQTLFYPLRAHLWFLYAIISIYFVLPFIKKIVNDMSVEEKKYFLYLFLILSGLMFIVSIFMGFKIKYPVPLISGAYYLGYFILGHLINEEVVKKDYKKYNLFLILTFVISSIFTIILTYGGSLYFDKYYDLFFAYRSIFIVLASLSIYSIVLINYPKDKKSKILTNLAEISFGIYLFHGIFLDILKKLIDFYSLNPIYSVLGLSLIIFIITAIAVYILRKIPFIKKYL